MINSQPVPVPTKPDISEKGFRHSCNSHLTCASLQQFFIVQVAQHLKMTEIIEFFLFFLLYNVLFINIVVIFAC